MNIVDFFDAYNPEHVDAYQHLSDTGCWPLGFIPEDTEFTPGWHVGILHKMADAWREAVINKKVFGY